ncbi:isochorismate synthase [Psychromonas marina]|uniref:Isochorismate synthase MenF n=1 Tax=Psychromonas marina TaxID=88364 RepID=A0ABQ6E5G4_9GAMM|nr:isochorismate synthase [Psychromonas marina]GLS92435.1 isochorismate synthase [Psychromonas marina]
MIEKICKELQQFKNVQGETPDNNLTISLDKFPLLTLVKAQTAIFPAIYWQDKEQQQTIACLGAIEDINTIPEAVGEARYYGGLAFQQQGEQWPNFPEIRFIRPALEFIEENNQLTLTCHFNGQFSIDETIEIVTKLHYPLALERLSVNTLTRTDLPDKKQWAELVDLSIEYKALLPKVVLSRQTELCCEESVNHCDLLGQWQLANPSSFHFSFQFCKETAFIGCSPERLFSREENRLQTEALAGTVNRGRNEREDKLLLQSLLTDKKIDRENYLVQEFIIANLKRLKAQVSCSEPHVMQLHNVQHLCVPIQAQLNAQTSDAELLYKLHPTPAVGGSPKLPALQFINDNEPYLRGWYAGAVGYISEQKSDFSVAIRSALIESNRIKLFAGAGIVTGSIAEQEWQELDNKIHTILNIITPQAAL